MGAPICSFLSMAIPCRGGRGMGVILQGDEPKTMADLRAHIAKTIAFLQSKLDADFSQFESGRYVPHWAGGKGMDGHTCVHEYAIPNFYFHLTMTYALLRRAGVDLGKGDYLGAIKLQ